MRIKAAAADALRNTLFRQMNSSAYFFALIALQYVHPVYLEVFPLKYRFLLTIL
jgi:hypothetical protein